MTKSTLRLMLFALALALLALGISYWLYWPRPGITRDNVAKIEVGMTLAEVEAIPGGPARSEIHVGGVVEDFLDPDEVRGTPMARWLPAPTPRQNKTAGTVSWWKSDEIMLGATIGADRRVQAIELMPLRRHPESFPEKMCRWIALTRYQQE